MQRHTPVLIVVLFVVSVAAWGLARAEPNCSAMPCTYIALIRAEIQPTPTTPPTPTISPITADSIIARFKAAKLEAANPRPMEPADYGYAPYLCSADARRFFIPSLGAGNGGRLFVCQDEADAARLKKYYDDLGASSAAFFSWTYQKRGVLVQLNGSLPPTKAAGYGAVIAALP